MLQFFSASTNIVNSKRAITECIENALQGETDLNCDLIIIFSAIGHNFHDLLSEAHKLSPGARITGCTGAGVIGKSGPDETMRALAIMVVKGPKNEFAIVHKENGKGINTFLTASEMAGELKRMNADINMILFLPDMIEWMPTDKGVEGIKSVFGQSMPVFGGVACDNVRGISSFHFYDNEVVERGAVIVGFADPTLKVLSQATHGFNVIEGMTLEVTRAEPGLIYELNGRPGWTVFTETLGIPESSTWVEALLVAGFARELPVDLQNEYGNRYMLFGCLEKKEDRSIVTPVTCNEGLKLRLTKRDEKKMFDDVDLMMKKIVEKLEGKQPLAVFHVDCALRGRASLNRILKDEIINRIQYPLTKGKEIPWLGFYSAGEIAMLGGQSMVHNFSSALSIIYR
jgi:hypothetical protein